MPVATVIIRESSGCSSRLPHDQPPLRSQGDAASLAYRRSPVHFIKVGDTLPDGPRFEKFYDTTAEQFTASKEGCDVRIGTNRFVRDLRRYRITAAIEEISIEIE